VALTQEAATQPVVEVRGLTVQLPKGGDRVNAVEDINFSIAPRETLCVVGESGSGKSVTAQAIMGLLPKKQLVVTAGEILLLGENLLTALPERLRALRGSRMGMIFQEPMTALNPVLTVGRQVEEVFATHSTLSPTDRARRVVDLLGSVKLADPERLVHVYPHQLSGGQRQRVMIAMALAMEPALLIADEPTTALDVTTQARILELINEIKISHNIGVLFITHDFGVVAEIADRVAVMQKGRIVEAGNAASVLGTPTHPYTRMLISSVPSMIPPDKRTNDAGAVVLRTRDLEMTYRGGGFFQRSREVHAVKKVSFSVQRGRTLGIVGESGSGKSTVARCIVRLINPTGGDIFIDDVEIAKLSPRRLHDYRRRIQIIFQDPYRSLNPRRRIGQSIVEGPLNYGISHDEAWRRAKDLLELVGLDPAVVDRYPHQFSGGQRQRVCIARALAMEPELLVADEAVSSLDVSVQAQVLDLLDDIRLRFNLALLFITHDLRVAAQVCDDIAVMHQGEIVETGPTADVFGNPQEAYTQALLAAAPGKEWRFGEGAITRRP